MSDSSEVSPWWSTYFDDVFLRIYRPLLDEGRTAVETEAIQELLAPEDGAEILDVGCGWGRHAVQLARAGYRVTGLDFSTYLLAEARRAAEAAGVTVELVRADMRQIPFRGAFDAALSLFSSLGYFGDDDDDARVLSGVRAAVKPGGSLVLETMHRDLIAREFLERDWWETPEGDQVRVEREFDPVAGVSHEILRWRSTDGSEGEKPHMVRVRTATEWQALLERCGWEPAEWFGGWDLDPFRHTSGRLIVLAKAV